MASGRWTARRSSYGARTPTRASRGSASVGSSILQTPGGVVAELDQANTDFNLFHEEIKSAALATGYPGSVASGKQPFVDFYLHTWIPLIQGWLEFYKKNKGWSDNLWWNHAPQAEQFIDKLIHARDQASKLGMQILSPPPTRERGSLLLDPQHNLIDDAADGAKKELDSVIKILKVALVAGLGLAGVLAVTAVSRRSGG